MNVPKQQLVAIAATYLEDPAQQWFNSLTSMPNIWKEFTDANVGLFFTPDIFSVSGLIR
jgi:hypothetical protein